MKCFNCERHGHFAADYRKPKSKERKLREINNRGQNWNGVKPSKKIKEQKALLADDNKRGWADSESDYSSAMRLMTRKSSA